MSEIQEVPRQGLVEELEQLLEEHMKQGDISQAPLDYVQGARRGNRIELETVEKVVKEAEEDDASEELLDKLRSIHSRLES